MKRFNDANNQLKSKERVNCHHNSWDKRPDPSLALNYPQNALLPRSFVEPATFLVLNNNIKLSSKRWTANNDL